VNLLDLFEVQFGVLTDSKNKSQKIIIKGHNEVCYSLLTVDVTGLLHTPIPEGQDCELHHVNTDTM
jgi:hypothetical protein